MTGLGVLIRDAEGVITGFSYLVRLGRAALVFVRLHRADLVPVPLNGDSIFGLAAPIGFVRYRSALVHRLQA
jgi:hypothetical protein